MMSVQRNRTNPTKRFKQRDPAERVKFNIPEIETMTMMQFSRAIDEFSGKTA